MRPKRFIVFSSISVFLYCSSVLGRCEIDLSIRSLDRAEVRELTALLRSKGYMPVTQDDVRGIPFEVVAYDGASCLPRVRDIFSVLVGHRIYSPGLNIDVEDEIRVLRPLVQMTKRRRLKESVLKLPACD